MLQAGSAQNTLVGLGRKPVPPSTTQGHALHGVSLLVTETPQGCPLLLKTSCGPRPVTELYLVRGSGHICGSQSCLCLPLRRREGRAGRRGGKEEEREGGKETVFGGCLQRDQPSMRESFTMSSATSRTSLPSGLAVFTTFPDVLFIPEMIFGGLVWILIASSKNLDSSLQGWVMFVSVFCFVLTAVLLFLYTCGVHGDSSSWVTLDVICQETAALFYFSASVLEAIATSVQSTPQVSDQALISYRENISASVFAFVATLLYVIHIIYSLRRWKSS
ncbi:myelin and lymphocyte protein-like [Meleagris gallopavo]|uniref:myelin and lymphocyte protein-like n=1 Tax=Meleagris gallopavo TaxID=9103 RepID=UPI000549A25E|nr:myelin and lymphocyte protein-like [Meleagris gallopavo]